MHIHDVHEPPYPMCSVFGDRELRSGTTALWVLDGWYAVAWQELDGWLMGVLMG